MSFSIPISSPVPLPSSTTPNKTSLRRKKHRHPLLETANLLNSPPPLHPFSHNLKPPTSTLEPHTQHPAPSQILLHARQIHPSISSGSPCLCNSGTSSSPNSGWYSSHITGRTVEFFLSTPKLSRPPPPCPHQSRAQYPNTPSNSDRTTRR